MSILDSIKINNRKLGIKTIFYNANDGVLGYSDKKKIYLNTFYNEEDIELVNKHETLHFFSKSKQFNIIKDLIFNILTKEQIEKIRSQYYLKYLSLYSYEELESGLLDEEIAIDIIVHNGDFPINIDEYVKDAYATIVEKSKKITFSPKTKRYLNISLSKKIDQQFPKLNKWEKLFVLNYYNGKDKIMPYNKNTKYEEVRNHIKEELNKLYKYGDEYSNFIIEYTSKEIYKKIAIEIKKLTLEGDVESAQIIEKNLEKHLKEYSNIISNNLQREYQNIVKILKESDYDDSFKYLMLQETLNRTYKKEKIEEKVVKLVDKRLDKESVASHMTLNKVVLDTIYNNIDKYDSFINLYFDSVDVFNEIVKKENSVDYEGIDTFNKGRWIRFESKKNNEDKFMENAQRLTALVSNTIWCTKTQASTHLEKGDYYVFVDNSGNPHIAIRMIGNEISEVRGIKNDNAQEIEEEYRDVVMEFLENNLNIKHGKEWLAKEEWNKRLVNYIEKIKSGTIDEIEIENLIHDISEVNDYKIHFHKNNNKEVLIDLISENLIIKEKIAKKYGCKAEEVHIGNYFLNFDSDVFPYVVVISDISFSNKENDIDFSKLKYVLGDVSTKENFDGNLRSLEFVLGKLNLRDSLIEELPKLKKVGGSLTLWKSNIEKLDNLEEIGNDIFARSSKVKKLKKLKRIGGNADFSFTLLKDLDSLEVVNGTLVTRDSEIRTLNSLEFIGGNADFSDSKIEKINNNCQIMGGINLTNTPLENKGLKR